MIDIRSNVAGLSVRSVESISSDANLPFEGTIGRVGTNVPTAVSGPIARNLPSKADQVFDFAMAHHADLLRKLAD